MNIQDRTIENSCYWPTTEKSVVSQPSLRGDVVTDIAIIGAGFTGLWAAYFLKKLEPSLRVSIVEQKTAGYGASGRNGGMIFASIDRSYAASLKNFGLEESKVLAELSKKNFSEFSSFAGDCDLELTGNVYAAMTQDHLDDLKGLVEAARVLNIPGYEMLDLEQIRNEINCPFYIGGLRTAEGGIVNPFKIVRKLRSEILAAGVQLFENSPVKRIEKGIVHTDSGTLRAGRVVMATDAYSHHIIPKLIYQYIPLYDYIMVSEPLSSEQLESMNWKSRRGIFDARNFPKYYRLTADNRILWGAGVAKYYPPNVVHPKHDYSEVFHKSLHESFERHFPALADLSFPYTWGGPIAATSRLSPTFGSVHNGHTLYALGYTGQGVVCTRFAGEVLSHAALGKKSTLLDLTIVKERPIPYPPEPLRSIAVGMIYNALKRVDRGNKPSLFLRGLEKFGINFSS